MYGFHSMRWLLLNTKAKKESWSRHRFLDAGIPIGVDEGSRTPGLQDHNLAL